MFTLTRHDTGRTFKIVRDTMGNLKEQRKDVVRDVGSAFSTTETLVLDGVSWEQFVAALESPPREIPQLVELFRAKAPWD